MELSEVLERLNALDPEARERLMEETVKRTADRKFIPSPGPQTDAWYSPADVLLYGGAGGGGKSSLLAGLALEQHRRSLLIRKSYSDLQKGGGLIDEVLKFHGSRVGFNGSPPAKLRFGDDRVITFGGVHNPGDEENFQGQPRDLLGIDEAVYLSEYQVRFLMGWVRSEIPGQRTRTVLATNPPLTAEGDWIIGMFRPWLDLTHPKPAKSGELRWFVTDPEGRDMEVDGPDPYQFPGQPKPVLPQSRTFIPSLLRDNPFLSHDSAYAAAQDNFPEPMRSAIRDGNFMLARQDDDFQVIPTEWIRAAQARWTPEPPAHAPMSAIAADVAQGGADNTILAARYDGWFAPLKVIPGVQTPTGNEVAGLVIAERRNGAAVIIDMGGGYGGATHMRLKDNLIEPLIAHKGAESSVRRTADQQFGFFNKRAEIAWRLREALDPGQDGGSSIALPDDPVLVSDLTALKFEITSSGIKVTPKEKLVDALGRSPDRGDAVMMANAYGPKLMTHGNEWRGYAGQKRSASVKVNMSRMSARRSR